MNLFKNDRELFQDKYCGLIFGENNQLHVLGYFRVGEYTKKYVVECSSCKQDNELFNNGRFIASIANIREGKYPCGCSPAPKWNPDQQIVRAERQLQMKGYNLVNYEKYNGQETKIVVNCPVHGEWSTSFMHVINGRGCRKCADNQNSINNRKPDELMIASFFASGAFHPRTEFWRSERKTSQGAKNYWYVFCPSCNSTGESTTSDLKRGFRPCDCFSNPRQAYVNIIYDDGFPVAIKYGITTNLKDRIYRQNKKSAYETENFGLWKFETKELCRAAEALCKREFPFPVLNSAEFIDGWSETTSILNLDRVIRIFETNGGLRLH